MLTVLRYLYPKQTLIMLNLKNNGIGAEGAQHLASALQVNTVRVKFFSSDRFFTIFTPNRHLKLFILAGTASAIKEHSIWQMPWK